MNSKKAGFVKQSRRISLNITVLLVFSLLSSCGKAPVAKQAEARNTIGASVRAQQDIFNKEKKPFALSWSDLGMGASQETENFRYTVSNVSGSSLVVASVAQPKSSDVKAFVGVVFISSSANGFTCESYNPTTSFPELSTIIVPTREAGRIVVTGNDVPPRTTVMCPKGYRDISGTDGGFNNP